MAESTASAPLPLGPPAGPPIGTAMEPLVVFVARGAPGPTHVDIGQMKYYLRPALIELQGKFQRKYGDLEGRSYCYCPLIHKSITHLEPDSDSFKSLTDILMYGRIHSCDIMFVLNHWDAITSDGPSFANIFKGFTDVKVTIRAHGTISADHNCEFHDLDAHKVSAHYQGLIRLEEQFLIDDALRYVVRVEEVRGVRIGVEESVTLMRDLTGEPEEQLLERVQWLL
ncbi:hypothetical protein E8E15_001456 [Penicillium rubens]|jgi:hypothetical protein|uniref:Uncharacterized protein n=2 Tax=Penicillium chrysogenum species complex TaxID=254878 RepID=B6HQM7_PENRW|nr:uncharacterized protein N7525_005158 [Penicillium rubens]KZN91336.1 hypothetical protein EN45_014680 [Penicillium chrysogenum]CAP98460.1 hypothetical protein PCH_Pc22g11720 [Penicillium rubens Wisconsin 54-1255]KAF3012447.1 hypothetical protein E8E15_001456 [Penicillium rubens]KAJ5044148.1 hypothetical protein NUH16_000946 [Penicillium rubens]KAJ5839970.1 hypothetical protein N7525_005158 [Penicillium rubens]